MLVFTFYVTCIFSGMIEVGAVLWGIGGGYSVEKALGLAIAYQIGNILLFFLNRKLRRMQGLFAAIACFLAAGIIFLDDPLHRYICAFLCFALLSTIIQTLRSAVKSKEPRWRKRCFRVIGFLIAAVMYNYGAYALVAISVMTLILTILCPKYEDDCWLTKLVRGQYGKNRICWAMTVHQMHYFVYCYSMLLIALFVYNSPFAASFWFVANWIPYILTEPLVKLTKTKSWLPFLVGGHILVAGLLIGMYITVEQYSLAAMILWALTGFGGGNVFCIKKSLLKYKEYHDQVWVFSENVGHFLGVVVALAVYHYTKYLPIVLLLGAIFALTTIILVSGTILTSQKTPAAENRRADMGRIPPGTYSTRGNDMFLYVGNRDLFGKGGISIFRYNENEAALEYLGTQHTDISAGFLAVDHENAYLFCVNEQVECRGVPGGQVLCLRIDPRTGDLKVLSSANTHTVLPCYVHYISDTRRLLVCNHAKRDWTLKIGLTDEGALCGQKVYDDAALEVFDVTQDGIITGPASYWAAPHASHASDNPHLHSITYDAQNRQFFVCDTGSDVIYTLALDDRGSPLLTSIADPCGEASAPRYGVLHPHLPVAYFNSEKQNAIFVFSICRGGLRQLQVIPALDPSDSTEGPIGQSAIAVNHAGTVLYTLVRQNRSISVFSIGRDGRLRFLQSYPVHYETPRAMAISPDDRNLFVACSTGRAMVHIKIGPDGKLSHPASEEFPLICPSSMALFDPRH